MKKFWNVFWVTNFVFFLFVAGITVLSLRNSFSASLVQTSGVVKVASGNYEYLITSLSTQLCFGAIQVVWVPDNEGLRAGPPPVETTKIHYAIGTDGYPYTRYANFSGSITEKGGYEYKWTIRNFQELGFQYTDCYSEKSTNNLVVSKKLAIRSLTIPYWILMLPWGFFTIRSARKRLIDRRRRTRTLKGHCIFCDYDLRGGVITCPECGRAATH